MGNRKYQGEVKSYSFGNIGEQVVHGQEYSFKNLDLNKKISLDVLSQEHNNAKQSGFVINQDVKEQRGLVNYEHGLYEDKVKNQVEIVLDKTKELAYQAGYENGLVKAKEEIDKSFLERYQVQVNELSQLVDFLKSKQTELVKNHRNEVLKIVQVVSQWVLNREVDVKYIERLIPIMLSKMQQDQKAIIKIDVKTYNELKNANELLAKFPSFQEIKLVADEHITHPGVIIEGESGLLDGTWETQQKMVEEIFLNLKESDYANRTSEG